MARIDDAKYPVLTSPLDADRILAYSTSSSRSSAGLLSITYGDLKTALSSEISTNFTPTQANLYSSVKSIIMAGSNVTVTPNDSANT